MYFIDSFNQLTVYYFNFIQKLREVVQKGRAETENLESLLREQEIEVGACKKEIEMHKVEKDNLEKKVSEVLHVGIIF